uniref:Secreted protein n=1 Tax=Macrostomum lignano TaxID=282301 RepID=A0A1I8F5F3_9PLAT
MHRLSILLLAAGLLATGLACCASGAAAAAPPAADSYLAAAASRHEPGPLQERLPLLQAAPSPVGRRGVQHRSGLCGGRDGSCSCGQGWAALREGPRLPASDGQRAAAVNSQRSYRSLLLKTIFRTELRIIRLRLRFLLASVKTPEHQ